MPRGGRAARTKGHNFERSVANYLKEKTGFTFKRGLSQTRSGSTEESDVVCEEIPLLHFECKKGKRTNIKGAYKQAIENMKDETGVPIIVTKDDREDTLVTMRIDDWIKLFNVWSHAITSPDFND
jgi:Holliday junction resolvase